jgi:hypothetical protein
MIQTRDDAVVSIAVRDEDPPARRATVKPMLSNADIAELARPGQAKNQLPDRGGRAPAVIDFSQ